MAESTPRTEMVFCESISRSSRRGRGRHGQIPRRGPAPDPSRRVVRSVRVECASPWPTSKTLRQQLYAKRTVSASVSVTATFCPATSALRDAEGHGDDDGDIFFDGVRVVDAVASHFGGVRLCDLYHAHLRVADVGDDAAGFCGDFFSPLA